MKRIAINGFGRIGRAALKVIMDQPGLEVVAVNDLMTIENAQYLLKYDSVYGIYDKEVHVEKDHLLVAGTTIKYFNQRDPELLPWKEHNIDIVIESTGFFTNREDAEKHIKAGATNVVISGPTKSKDTPTVVHGVNTKDGKTAIFSCASCTTNNISPVVEILGRTVGVKKAILNTIHAYTASQTLVDTPSKKNPRMGRAGAVNLTPTSTGAAIATTKALPQLEGKFDGIAVRTPVPVGSVSDVTFIAERNTTSTVDASMTRVVDGDLVKIMIWYDNEWGFTNQMIRQILEL